MKGENNALDIVVKLLINDYSLLNSGQKTIFNPHFKWTGIATCIRQNMTVVNFAESFRSNSASTAITTTYNKQADKK